MMNIQFRESSGISCACLLFVFGAGILFCCVCIYGYSQPLMSLPMTTAPNESRGIQLFAAGESDIRGSLRTALSNVGAGTSNFGNRKHGYNQSLESLPEPDESRDIRLPVVGESDSRGSLKTALSSATDFVRFYKGRTGWVNDTECDIHNGDAWLEEFRNLSAWRTLCARIPGGKSELRCRMPSGVNGRDTTFVCEGSSFRMSQREKEWIMEGDCEMTESPGFKDRWNNIQKFPKYVQVQNIPACTDNLNTVLYTQRIIDPWNPCENMPQHFMTFVSLYFFGDPNVDGMMSQFTGGRAKRPLEEFYNLTYGPLMVGDLQSKSVCMNRVVMPLAGRYIPHYSVINKPYPLNKKCRNSPILRAYGSWIQSRLGRPVSAMSPGFKVVYFIRNDFLKRHITNRAELVSALKNQTESYKRGSFIAKFPTDISVREQLDTVRTASVIIAVHGASLTWMLEMPHDCAQIVEFCTGADFHFVNIAASAGIEHTCLKGTSHQAASFRADVGKAVNAVAQAHDRWQSCMDKHPRIDKIPN